MADEFEPVHDEFEPVADEFEPVAAGPSKPSADADRWRMLLDKAKAAGLGVGQGALAGFADEAAGGVGAVAEKIAGALGAPGASNRSFVDMYREGRDYARKTHDQARAENPWTYGLSQVGGGVASMAAMPGNMAARGAQAVKQGAVLGGLSGLGGSRADLTKGAVGGAALDTGIGAGIGAATSWLLPKVTDKVINYFKNPVAQAKVGIGEAAQVPQRAYEGVAERVGRTDMAQQSTSAAGDVSGPLASAQVKALRQIRDNADLGSELAASLHAASDNLGGTGNKLVSAMTQDERGQVAKAMAELLQTRGMKDVTPEFVASNMDDLAKAAGLDLTDLTGNAFLRMANKRDPQWWVSAGEGVRKFWTSRGMAGESMDPRLQGQFSGNRDLADDFARGQLDRLGRPMSDAGAGKYQFGVGEMGGKLGDAQGAALGRIQARSAERAAAADPSAMVRTDPGGMAPMQAGVRSAGNRAPTSAEFGGFSSDVADHRIAQGAGPAGKTIDELFPTLGPAARQREAAANATGRLRDIATGRNFIEQKALPLAGAIAGGGSGAGLGALGFLSGVPLGAQAASKAPRIADALSELGQGAATGGRDAIKQAALRAVGNPQKIQSLAQVPGAVGDAARRALEVAKDPAAFAARSYMLSMMPEFRQMLAGDDDDRAQQ